MRRLLLLALLLPACGGLGADTLPAENGLSYRNDVFPAFERRGCVECHSGNGPGRDDGGLMLDSGSNPVHRELTEEQSPNWAQVRVRVDAPESSLLLQMPLGTAPHNAIFSSTSDPDYELFLEWILEGAPKN